MSKLFDRVLRRQHSLGFGIQSPGAYRFVRYVVCEPSPYGAYLSLHRGYPSLSRRQRRVAELLFRLANRQQSTEAVLFGDMPEAFTGYLTAGCNKTSVQTASVNAAGVDAERHKAVSYTGQFLVVEPSCGYRQFMDKAIAEVSACSLIVVLDIHRDREIFAYWQELIASPKATLAIDLRECGIILFDPNLPRQNVTALL